MTTISRLDSDHASSAEPAWWLQRATPIAVQSLRLTPSGAVMKNRLISIVTLTMVSSLAACAAQTDAGVDPGEEQATEALINDPIYEPMPDDPAPTVVPFSTLCSNYSTYDINADGIDEINSLALMPFEPATASSAPNGMVVVFVDPRVLADFTGSRRTELSIYLANWRQDLVNDGFAPRFVSASVYSGAAHQDGLTVLAMRRFLKAVRANYPSLKGAILFGSFPEAAIVHSTLRRKDDATSITLNGTTYNNVDYLEMHPNRINATSDLVLGDLDGNWESIYRKDSIAIPHWTMIPDNTATWPVAGQYVSATRFQYTTANWEDVFHVRDEQTVVYSQTSTKLIIRVDSPLPRNQELTSSDKLLANPLARPEIVVSRINAKGIALEPYAPPDRNGKTPVMDGKPQDLVYDGSSPSIDWRFDQKLEQRILIDYLYRNSAFRHGVDHSLPFITSAVRSEEPPERLLISPTTINTFLQSAGSFSSSYSKDMANLAEYMQFLRRPAVLRGIESHSSSTSSAFSDASSSEVIAALGGKPWLWTKTTSGSTTYLTVNAATGDAKMAVYRAAWENGALSAAGQAFYIHGGCDVTLPWGSEHDPYDDVSYGRKQNGASILFFANGLALYGRSKVFNDKADGFPQGIKALAPNYFGKGWRAQFDHDGANSGLASQPYQRKKAYYWTMMGDWTLKLRY
jgi:hypothetical protein